MTHAEGRQPAPDPAVPLADRAAFQPPWRKIAVLGIVAVVLIGAVYFSHLGDYLRRTKEMSEYIRGLGWLGPVVLTAGVAVLVAVGFPRLLFCVISGMAFGFWRGLLWAQLGALLGNYATFAFARLVARGWAERWVRRWARGRVLAMVEQNGLAGVIVARQAPVPGLIVNLGCALLPLRQRDYLIGTAAGQLVEAVPLTLIGAGALQPSFARSAGLIGVAVGLGVAAWIGLRWFLGHRSAPTKG